MSVAVADPLCPAFLVDDHVEDSGVVVGEPALVEGGGNSMRSHRSSSGTTSSSSRRRSTAAQPGSVTATATTTTTTYVSKTGLIPPPRHKRKTGLRRKVSRRNSSMLVRKRELKVSPRKRVIGTCVCSWGTHDHGRRMWNSKLDRVSYGRRGETGRDPTKGGFAWIKFGLTHYILLIAWS